MPLTDAQIQQKLGEIEELRQALIDQVAGQTTQEKIAALAEAQPHIKPKTKAMEALLMAGYGMSIATAEQIIKERKDNPQSWPFEKYEAAMAMIEAYKATPQVISTRPGWKRAINY